MHTVLIKEWHHCNQTRQMPLERGTRKDQGRLSDKGRGCVGQGQRLLLYFFMKTTVTEERQNEWPVKRNENK